MVDTAPLRVQRIGDEERQRAAEILADQHARGRLNQEQFEERLGAAFAAETTSDLGRVLADLPIRAPVPSSSAAAPTSGWRDSIPSDLRWIFGAFVAVLALGVAAGLSVWFLNTLFGGVFIWDILRAFANNPSYLLVAFVAGLLGLLVGLAIGRRPRRPQ